jgi:hypothetical protein
LEVTVRAGSDAEFGLANLMRDPLIRLVMKSDGVTEQAMMALMDQVRRSLTLRASDVGSVHSSLASSHQHRHAGSAVIIPFPADRNDSQR